MRIDRVNKWIYWKKVRGITYTKYVWASLIFPILQKFNLSFIHLSLPSYIKKLPCYIRTSKDANKINTFIEALKKLIAKKSIELQESITQDKDQLDFLQKFLPKNNQWKACSNDIDREQLHNTCSSLYDTYSGYCMELSQLENDLSIIQKILAAIENFTISFVLPIIQALYIVLKCIVQVIIAIQVSSISIDLLHRLKLSIQTLSIRILTTPKAVQSF